MTDAARERLMAFLRPLYQDLDGVSRVDDVERIAALARRLHPIASDALELLLAFHLLGTWLEKVGNASRTTLATGIADAELRRTATSIRRLEDPQTDEERAVAAAVLIDGAGVRGLAERFARSRREGRSVIDVAREAVGEDEVPGWMSDEARAMLDERRARRKEFAAAVLADS
jgi:hypothetical protein